MIKIRLKRLGAKRNPIYRVIVIDGREKREGRPLEELGYYNPKKKDLKLNKEKALEWIKKGAQTTETVEYLINNCDEEGQLIRKESTEKKLSKKAKAKLEEEKAAEEERKAEEAAKKAEEEAAAKEAEESKTEEAPTEEPKAEEKAEA